MEEIEVKRVFAIGIETKIEIGTGIGTAVVTVIEIEIEGVTAEREGAVVLLTQPFSHPIKERLQVISHPRLREEGIEEEEEEVMTNNGDSLLTEKVVVSCHPQKRKVTAGIEVVAKEGAGVNEIGDIIESVKIGMKVDRKPNKAFCGKKIIMI